MHKMQIKYIAWIGQDLLPKTHWRTATWWIQRMISYVLPLRARTSAMAHTSSDCIVYCQNGDFIVTRAETSKNALLLLVAGLGDVAMLLEQKMSAWWCQRSLYWCHTQIINEKGFKIQHISSINWKQDYFHHHPSIRAHDAAPLQRDACAWSWQSCWAGRSPAVTGTCQPWSGASRPLKSRVS